jgi:hypothetical protein
MLWPAPQGAKPKEQQIAPLHNKEHARYSREMREPAPIFEVAPDLDETRCTTQKMAVCCADMKSF